MWRHKYLSISLIAVGLYALWSLLFLPLSAGYTPLCGSCHATSRAYRNARLSPHKEIGCLACHRNPTLGGRLASDFRGMRNLTASLGGSAARAQHVDNDACLACHNQVAVGISNGAKIKMSHREVIEAGWRCATCHGNTGHNLGGIKETLQNPSMDKCFGCHLSQPGLKTCRTCHAAAVAKNGEKSVAALGAFAHTKDWKKKHGSAPLSGCPVCHKGTFCKSCHKVNLPHNKNSWTYEHSAASLADAKPCYRCHRAKFCLDCHETPMPHPSGYKQKHGSDRLSAGPLCLNCHLEYQCAACHRAHRVHRVRR